MKRLIFILAVLLLNVAVFAQSDYSYTLTTNNDVSGTLWNYTDTLGTTEAIDALIRVRGGTVMDLNFQVIVDELSGGVTATITTLGSNDGVTYVAVTSTISGALTADGSIWVKVNDFNYSYFKLLMSATGSSTSTYKCYYSIRKE